MNSTDFVKGQTAKSQLFCYHNFNYVESWGFPEVDIYTSSDEFYPMCSYDFDVGLILQAIRGTEYK